MNLISALDVCYGVSDTEGTPPPPVLACATNVAEHLAALYDSLTRSHPRKVLSRERLDQVLKTVDLPPISDNNGTAKFTSVNDFQRIICRQYCVKRGLEYRLPGRLTVQQIYDVMQKDAHDRSTAQTLRAVNNVCQLQQQAKVMKAGNSQQVLNNVSVENLMRVVLRQQTEIDALKDFSAELVDAVKDAHVQLVTVNVDAIPAHETKVPHVDLYDTVKSLQRLRSTLLQVTPRCPGLTQPELEDDSTATETMCTAPDRTVAAPLCPMDTTDGAEDSGWMSDDEDGLQSEMVCLGAGSNRLKHVPDLPFDSLTPSQAPSLPQEQTTPTTLSDSNRQIAVKKRLSSLAHKLKDTEIMLSVFLEHDEQSLVD